jgi:oligopeptide transport system permease protein
VRSTAWFICKRLLMAIPVLWAALTLLFAVFFVLPGDRVDAIVGGDRVLTPAVRANVTHKLGLDQPVLVQYGRYMNRLVHGDLGDSFTTGRSVVSIIKTTAPESLRLAFWAIVIEAVVGVFFGVITALSRSRSLRALTSVWGALVLAIPLFVIGLVLQLALGVYPFEHGWPGWLTFPTTASSQPDTWWLGVIPQGDEWRYLVLPAVTLAAASTVIVSRLMHVSLRDAMRSDYVRGARARGVAPRTVLMKHGMRAAIVPVITFIGLDLGALFGSAVVTERIFSWPGIGSEIADGLERQDAPVLLGMTALLVVVYVIVNLLVDVVHRRLDPRIATRPVR